MPSFAANLEKTLHAALTDAGERRHEYATLEHLLLALYEEEEDDGVLHSAGIDWDRFECDLRAALEAITPS